MKHKYYKEQFGDDGFFYGLNNADDLLDIKRFAKRKFNSLKELVDTNTERKALVKCRKIVKDLFKEIATDIIDGSGCFILPYKDFGFIKVSNIPEHKLKNYRYNINTEGKNYGGKLFLDKKILRNTKKHFSLRFNRNLNKRIYNNLINGTHY